MRSKVDEWLTDDGLTQIRGWARDGYTMQSIADSIGISLATLYTWFKKYPQVLEAIKKGQQPFDIVVEDTLEKLVTGFHTTVKKAIKVRTKKEIKGKGIVEEEHIECIDEDTYIPPSPAAIFFWLKNRKPDKWRDKPLSAKDKKEMELMQARIDALTTANSATIDEETRKAVDDFINDVEPVEEDDEQADGEDT